MTVTNLYDLDAAWEGENIDKSALKILCRKYDPRIIMDWIHRGLTINEKKEELIKWHKQSLEGLGEKIIYPEQMPNEGIENLAEQFGEYFT